MDHITGHILSLGRGALMAKVDVKQAYRVVPVHPDDRCLLGVHWNDQVIVDKVLPFGLRSAPLIFTGLADALQWIMEKNGVRNVFHYLDDFITLGPAGAPTCQKNLEGIIRICEQTGVPLDVEKSEGPSPVLTFLGMELDTIKLEIRLPVDKLARLKDLLQHWEARRAGKKRPALTHWLSTACSKSSETGSLIHTSPNQCINSSTSVRWLYPAKQVSTFTYSVVVSIGLRMEWHFYASQK